MNWQMDIGILMQLLSLAAVAGIGWSKISVLERDLERIEKEVVDSRELRAQLAVVNSKLSSIEHTLEKLITKLDEVE